MSCWCPNEQQSFNSFVPVYNHQSKSPFFRTKIKFFKMNSIAVIVLLASLAACAADVSHLSRSYLPPLSGASGYAYSSYPSYSGSAYSSTGYYGGSNLATGYGAPLITSGYNSYASVPQYNTYPTPSRSYLPPVTNYGSLDTKYAANGGYIY